jgi:hypothetical protein
MDLPKIKWMIRGWDRENCARIVSREANNEKESQ